MPIPSLGKKSAGPSQLIVTSEQGRGTVESQRLQKRPPTEKDPSWNSYRTYAPRVERADCAEAKRARRLPNMANDWWSATAFLHTAADDSCGRAWSCSWRSCLAGP